MSPLPWSSPEFVFVPPGVLVVFGAISVLIGVAGMIRPGGPVVGRTRKTAAVNILLGTFSVLLGLFG